MTVHTHIILCSVSWNIRQSFLLLSLLLLLLSLLFLLLLLLLLLLCSFHIIYLFNLKWYFLYHIAELRSRISWLWRRRLSSRSSQQPKRRSWRPTPSRRSRSSWNDKRLDWKEQLTVSWRRPTRLPSHLLSESYRCVVILAQEFCCPRKCSEIECLYRLPSRYLLSDVLCTGLYDAKWICFISLLK